MPKSTPKPTSRQDAARATGSDQVFKTVFDATFESLWVLSPEGTLQSANRAALEGAGVTLEEVTGKPLWETPWWAFSDESKGLVRRAVADAREEATRNEAQMQIFDGSLVWVDLFVKPVRDPGGGMHLLVVEGRDITERKQALEHLKQREALLSQAQALAQLGSWTWDAASNSFSWTEGLYRLYGFDDNAPPTQAEEFTPRVHPDDLEAQSNALRTAMASDEPQEYYSRVVHPDGQVRLVRGVGSRETNPDGEVVRVYGIVQDVTSQQHMERRLASNLERLSLVSELAQTVTTTLDTARIYERVMAKLRDLIGADAVLLFEHEGQELVVRAAYSVESKPFVGVRIDDEKTIAGQGWRRGESLLLAGDAAMNQIHPNVTEALGYRPRAALSVPMHWQGERVGVMQAFHTEEDTFDEGDLQVFGIAAVWLAIAIINARIYEQQQGARRFAEQQRERMRVLTRRVLSAQEDERKRIARELHDEAGQALAVLKMNLSLLRNEIPSDELRARLEESIDLTGQTAKNVRLLAHNLRPPALDAFGLVDTLSDLCRRYGSLTEIPVEFSAEAIPPLPDDFGVVCYRFVQEALANITKHAEATEVSVSMKDEDNCLVLEVRDNGKGFDLEKARSGIGVLGMTERLELLNGRLEIHSGIGEGTRLVAYVPYDRNDPDAC